GASLLEFLGPRSSSELPEPCPGLVDGGSAVSGLGLKLSAIQRSKWFSLFDPLAFVFLKLHYPPGNLKPDVYLGDLDIARKKERAFLRPLVGELKEKGSAAGHKPGH
ncbi:MAG: hypothetical protein PVG55_00695, partial [Nitrospirota bacterium]